MQPWTVSGWVEVDAASCAFADADALGPDFSLADVTGQGGVVDGLPVVWCPTGADVRLPVEVQEDAAGQVVSARLLFVTDVDHLDWAGDGEWEPIGTIDIASGRCVACDPFCFSNDPCYRLEFGVKAGRWSAQRFYCDGDVLGLRITLDEQGDAGPR